MKRADVVIGEAYWAKVSGVKVLVRITRENPYGGWDAVNLTTGRTVRIKTAGRLTQYCDIAPCEFVRRAIEGR